jgi:23S rRNA pseudouridine1911/1915/1917 synthase
MSRIIHHVPGLLDVLHEDDDLLVVDKPADLVCHPTKDGERSSLIGRVRLHLRHEGGRLVQRLDRETSGVVVLAKSAEVARELGRLVASGAVTKTYLAVVHGALDGERVIRAPLGPDEASPVAIKDRVRDDGAPAETAVRALRAIERAGRRLTLVEVHPRTGRKHQIRIHLAHAGHPVVGDKLYGADEQIYLRLVAGTMTDADRAALIVPTHALHAARISFHWRDRDWTFDAPPGPVIRTLAGPLALRP